MDNLNIFFDPYKSCVIGLIVYVMYVIFWVMFDFLDNGSSASEICGSKGVNRTVRYLLPDIVQAYYILLKSKYWNSMHENATLKDNESLQTKTMIMCLKTMLLGK